MDLVSLVDEVTDGRGVAAVYDGVGTATFDDSLRTLAIRGSYLVYGFASGPVPPVEVGQLAASGSIFLTRPTVVHYTRTAEELRGRARELFSWLTAGSLRVSIGGRFGFERVADAFAALEARQTTGELVLTHRGPGRS